MNFNTGVDFESDTFYHFDINIDIKWNLMIIPIIHSGSNLNMPFILTYLIKLALILHSFYNCFQCQKTFNAKIMPPRMCMDVLQLEDKKNCCFKLKAQ